PDWAAVLVDLRLHGDSLDAAPPHTVTACAADLRELPLDLPLAGALGHSFGGKVALALAQQASLHELWLIDSMPGARPDRHGSEAIAKVLAALRAVPARHADRDAFVAALRAEGVAEPLGRWLAMSLKREDDGQMRYPVDLDAIDGLLDDYFALDLWGALPGANRAHVVIGEKSEVFAGPDRERVRALAAEDPRLEVHLVEGAGHWVHVEKPSALAALFG
ncbi:MAG TPA: alpha/beta fold hydrolase, partial [Polyangiaceae bacterium LLY-WYZ-15_(1-7)]|nr:alpha/beta fold hydrolase [Polyangiaceae bacterium LLY-WYZ-15_(1-7)]